MDRWSFVKRFGRISFEDFADFAKEFCDAVDSCYKGSSVVTVTFYKQLPHSITTVEPGLNEWIDEENKKRELAEVVGLENITKELFDQAVNVQLVIRPRNDSWAPRSTFGALECKGLLNRHLVYYAQPEAVSEHVKKVLLDEKGPSRLLFGLGDGYEHCHSVSLG